MKRLVQLAVLAALMLAAPVQAVKRYSCDFESQAARDRWVINPTATSQIASQLKNKWYIGEPGNNSKTGQYGLYISDDEGASAHYRNTGCWNYAYDTVSLDHLESGDYTMVFDYCVMGSEASKFDGLYFFWIPLNKVNGDTIILRSSATAPGSTIPSWLDDYVIRLQPQAMMDYLGGTITWRQCAVTIPNSMCNGEPHYLAFVWTNGSFMAQQPGAMIDNINISDNKPCDQPTDLKVDPQGTTVAVSWQGTATDYEVSAYSYDAKQWYGPKIVTGKSTNLSGLPIGQTDFIVRAKCDEDFYSLKTIASALIYYPDQLCVDYLNLSNAKCYIAGSSTHPSTSTYTDFTEVPAVDKGSSNVESFHTVHFDRTELEPRTGNMAHTVPDRELASVRLGNWDDEEFAERIEFSFDVDTVNYPVLLLKYMPILEAPDHNDDQNPRFMLDILVGNTSIGRCGMADFNANSVRGPDGGLTKEAKKQGWHIQPAAEGFSNIVWKEWTTVGVNLKKPEYQGKTLTARLTTFDCIYNAHFGYAYFTLGCSDGKLKDMKCGEVNPTFKAPDGFNYRWSYAYNEKYRDPVTKAMPPQYVLGREQLYDAGYQDDSLYVVDCMFVQDSTCFFSLYASTLATNPISLQNEPVIVRSCRENKYTITFDASPSWVQEINHVKHDTVVSKTYHIEHYEWNIGGISGGWSDEIKPTFTFPSTGGDFPVSLRTTCGSCESVLNYVLHLDPLGPTHDTVTVTLCDELRKTIGYKWREKPKNAYFDYGLDSVVLYSETTSCDSIIYLNLIEPVRILEDTMILPEDLPYTRHGRTYPKGTTSLVDTIPFPGETCDSTWVFNLEIYENLVVSADTSYIYCEGADSLIFNYTVTRGRSQSVVYSFASNKIPGGTLFDKEQKSGNYDTLGIALDPNLEPDNYKGALVFEDMKPEFSVTIPFTMSIQYDDRVIVQRWNDVLAIRNDSTIKDILGDRGYDYNFTGVQWFVDGMPVEGATAFNYYTGADKELLFGKDYQALLTRPDGAQVFTCAYTPAPVPEAAMPYPQLTDMVVEPKASLHMSGKGTAYWYDMLGRRHHTDTYDDSDITAPGTVGFYLLVTQEENTQSVRHTLVR